MFGLVRSSTWSRCVSGLRSSTWSRCVSGLRSSTWSRCVSGSRSSTWSRCVSGSRSSTWSRCVTGSRSWSRCVSGSRSWSRCASHSSEEFIRRFIGENTEVVGEQSLTPELRLRLFTPSCRFWTERPELWPYEDPYWAIYWPGGQALSRFLLDRPAVCRGRTVLDLGSGCGASALAAILCGAAHVVANDIDPVAAVATHMNSELNGLRPPVCLTRDIMGSPPAAFDLILLGDMFYDESLAASLHSWLKRCVESHGTTVLIGDPGRAPFEEHAIRRLLKPLAEFELPDSVREENHGLSCCGVWSYTPEL